MGVYPVGNDLERILSRSPVSVDSSAFLQDRGVVTRMVTIHTMDVHYVKHTTSGLLPSSCKEADTVDVSAHNIGDLFWMGPKDVVPTPAVKQCKIVSATQNLRKPPRNAIPAPTWDLTSSITLEGTTYEAVKGEKACFISNCEEDRVTRRLRRSCQRGNWQKIDKLAGLQDFDQRFTSKLVGRCHLQCP